MFVERLTDKEILEIAQLSVKHEVELAKFFYLPQEKFNFIKKNKKKLHYIFNCYNKCNTIIFYTDNFIERKICNDGEHIANVEFNAFFVYKGKRKKNDKYKTYFNSMTIRYNLRDFNFTFSATCIMDYYKYMYKKFGKEYLDAFKIFKLQEKECFIKHYDDSCNCCINEMIK